MLADDTGDASSVYVPNMVLMSFALLLSGKMMASW